MKTAEIKDLLKKELLIIELQTGVINSSYHIRTTPKGILIKDDVDEKFISNKYTLLGKPDEIREEDAKELVQCINVGTTNKYVASVKFFNNVNNRYYKTATESLLSAIESVIYWENPLGIIEPIENFQSSTFGGEKTTIHRNPMNVLWHESQSRTFDRNRSIILVKI